MEKYLLIYVSDENLEIDKRGEFTNLEDAQKMMREEWESEEPDIEYGDEIKEMSATICGTYVYLWRIFKVSLD